MPTTTTKTIQWTLSEDELKITATVGGRRYSFFLTPETEADVLREITDYANDPSTDLLPDDAKAIALLIQSLSHSSNHLESDADTVFRLVDWLRGGELEIDNKLPRQRIDRLFCVSLIVWCAAMFVLFCLLTGETT